MDGPFDVTKRWWLAPLFSPSLPPAGDQRKQSTSARWWSRRVTQAGSGGHCGEKRLLTPFTPLFETLGLEVSQGVVFDGIADLEGVAADLTVFDVGVTANREVQDHRDLFAAKGTGEGVFHDASTVPQIPVA